MKKLLVFTFFYITLSLVGFSQNRYSTTNNRVLLSGIVNQDTFLIENIKNKVLLDGQLGLIRVEFSNQDARRVSKNFSDYTTKKGNINIIFGNDYMWIDEHFKSDQPVVSFQDEIKVTINNHEELVMADFTITKVRGTQALTSIIEINGSFPAENYDFDIPDFDFKEDVNFVIQLTIQVRN